MRYAVLHHLDARNLPRHNVPYWANGDPEVVRNAITFSVIAWTLDHLLCPESLNAWLATARDGPAGDR